MSAYRTGAEPYKTEAPPKEPRKPFFRTRLRVYLGLCAIELVLPLACGALAQAAAGLWLACGLVSLAILFVLIFIATCHVYPDETYKKERWDDEWHS